MPRPSLAARITGLLGRRGYRTLVIAYDPRDNPQPWTVELRAHGKLVALRYASTLDAAVASVESIDRTGA